MKTKKKKLKKILRKAIIALFDENPKQVYNYKQLAGIFEIKDSTSRKLIIDILNQLKEEERLLEKSRGKFVLNSVRRTITGVIEITRKGSGYVINEVTEDIFVPENNTRNALHGDTVEITTYRTGRRKKLQGDVQNILKRAKTEFVGTIEISKKFAFVTPDNNKIHVDFFISKDKIKKAKNGDKVVVQLIDWPPTADSPFGEVIKVLGKAGEHETEIHAIMADYGLPYEFPPEVEQYAKDIPEEITNKEIKKRRDFRETTTFTIDPDDAKDFDDALSFTEVEKGIYEIGVHIADVSHYVRPRSVLDDDAYARGTSVYLVDRVVPMLPENLSNGVCSLRPNEDKLTFSVVFKINDNAKILDVWLGKTIIHSDKRFTYEDAQTIIETKKGDFSTEVLKLNELAQKFRKNRLKKGGLEIESSEVKFKLDEKGKPIGVYQKISKEAHKLIEEFMLLANKHVASYVGKPEKNKIIRPFVYRVHEPPAPEKVSKLKLFLEHFDHKISNLNPDNLSQKIGALMKELKEKDLQEAAIIQEMTIRTMSKAVYDIKPLGHYGLSFDYYSHFTSPIRRYPDLIVHRLLYNYLNNNYKTDESYLELACKHTSTRERVATEAERESIKFKQVEYLAEKVGETFTGIISGMTEYGMFIELKENRCEGLVRLNTITDDRFYFDEAAYRVVGKRYKHTFYLGDEVVIEVAKVDVLKRQIDMRIVEYGF